MSGDGFTAADRELLLDVRRMLRVALGLDTPADDAEAIGAEYLRGQTPEAAEVLRIARHICPTES